MNSIPLSPSNVKLKVTLSDTGYTTSKGLYLYEVDSPDNDDGDISDIALDDLFKVRLSCEKTEAPYFMCCVLRDLASGKTIKSGRRSERDALWGTGLTFDIDHGNVEASQVEQALTSLGIGGVYWTTWSAKPGDFRWRVFCAFSFPVSPKSYKAIWLKWAKAFTKALGNAGAQIREGEKGTLLDWQGSGLTKPSLLPCKLNEVEVLLRPVPAGCKESVGTPYPWGGVTPKPVGVPGVAIPVGAEEEALAKKLLSTPYKESSKAAKKEYPGTGILALTPYLGDSAAPHLTETLWLMQDSSKVPGLVQSVDALCSLRMMGIRCGKGARQVVLYQACLAAYRVGQVDPDIVLLVEEIIKSSPEKDQDYLIDQGSKILSRFTDSCRKNDRHAQVLAEAVRQEDKSKDRALTTKQNPALITYSRILARADHLRRPEGGQLDHEAISKIVGVGVTVVTAWRGQMRKAGLIRETGECSGRKYFLPLEGTTFTNQEQS